MFVSLMYSCIMSPWANDRMAAKGARNGGGSGHGPGRRGVLSFKLQVEVQHNIKI